MVPDESGYRKAVSNWYAKSWIKNVLYELSLAGYNVIMTSDHGSVMVSEWATVSADKSSSTGIRYKYGTNINTSDKKALDIRILNEYRLPDLGVRANYLIAKDNSFVFDLRSIATFLSIIIGAIVLFKIPCRW